MKVIRIVASSTSLGKLETWAQQLELDFIRRPQGTSTTMSTCITSLYQSMQTDWGNCVVIKSRRCRTMLWHRKASNHATWGGPHELHAVHSLSDSSLWLYRDIYSSSQSIDNRYYSTYVSRISVSYSWPEAAEAEPADCCVCSSSSNNLTTCCLITFTASPVHKNNQKTAE